MLPPTPIEAIMLNPTGVGLTDVIMQTDQELLPRDQRLRALPPLHRSSMVDHYKDAIQRRMKPYVARSHRSYSIPHDPDRACDLQWIYLPSHVVPSSVRDPQRTTDRKAQNGAKRVFPVKSSQT